MANTLTYQPSLFERRPIAPILQNEIQLTGWRMVLKDIADRIVGCLLLFLLAPLIALMALAIRLSSGGPVLVRQRRVGRGGREFMLYKFRTLAVLHTEEDELAPLLHRPDYGVLSLIPRAYRLTTVGRYLRLSGLDELPQVWNVVRGDMSLVGPRPRLPEQLSHLNSSTLRLLLVKPGLTGLAQVHAMPDGPARDAVDLIYVECWTFLLDLSILWQTARYALYWREATEDPYGPI